MWVCERLLLLSLPRHVGAPPQAHLQPAASRAPCATQTDGTNPGQDRAAAELLAAAGFEAVRKPNDPPASEMARVSSVFVHRDAWAELAHSPYLSEVVLE